MISRKDMVDRFEEVVKQEIINHNREIEASNQRMNDLTMNVETFNRRLDGDVYNLKIMIAESHHILQDKLDKLSNQLIELTKKVCDLETELNVSNKRIFELEKDQINTNSQIEDLLKKLMDLNTDLMHVSKHGFMVRTELIGRTESQLQKLSEEINKEIDLLKNRPSEVEPVKEELVKRMDIDRVDFQGVMKELQCVKKTSFVQEKKIENLYTLIDRINKKLG